MNLKLKNAGIHRRFLIPRKQPGFTMIELIATMVIMGILATSTISNYSDFNMGLRIFEEVKDMSRKITYARDYCSARKEKFFLKVDTDTDQYSFFHQNNSTELNSITAEGKISEDVEGKLNEAITSFKGGFTA